MQGKRVVLAVSGSIAAYKALILLRLLRERGAHVIPMLTQSAQQFVTPLSFSALAGVPTITSLWQEGERGSIKHIEAAHDADLILIAPATADLIARLSQGRADDVVTSTVLSSAAPKFIAPAMETGMWQNPATQHNIAILKSRGFVVIGPEEGALASGHAGIGRMAEPNTILRAVIGTQDLVQENILITAGPTREALDPARFLSNASTGRMGIALATAAQSRGAQVTLVLGPTELQAPAGILVLHVSSTRDMLAACEANIGSASMLIMAAAPADYRPQHPEPRKMKKTEHTATSLALEPNPDILQALNARTSDRIVVGFAAETHDIEHYARTKLQTKDLDLIVANPIGCTDAGFGSNTNRVILISRDGHVSALPCMRKEDVAHAILDSTLSIRKARHLVP